MAIPVVRVAFLDVGQGDSIIITIPETGEALLVDCIDAVAAVDYLEGQGIKFIRGLIITHLHADHYREAVQFLENCVSVVPGGCEGVWLNPIPTANALSAFLKDDHSNEVERTAARRKQLFRTWGNWGESNSGLVHQVDVLTALPLQGRMGDVIQLLHPRPAFFTKSLSQGYNNTSLVIRVSGPDSHALLPGDIEPSGWELLKSYVPASDLKSQVLKWPHHGAWKGDAEALVKDVQPEIAVISVGTNGFTEYGHPNKHVLGALRARGIRILCTQATEQCTAKLEAHTKAVSQALEAHVGGIENGHYRDSAGCPCAGTVVVDLADKPVLIQPVLSFHRDQVVVRFFETAQCRDPAKAPVANP